MGEHHKRLKCKRAVYAGIALSAVVIVAWAWQGIAIANEIEADIYAVFEKFRIAERDGDSDALLAMITPRMMETAEELLDAALNDDRESLMKRDIILLSGVLDLRFTFSRQQLQQMSPRDFWAHSFSETEPDPEPPTLVGVRVEEGVAWASIKPTSGEMRAEGEFFFLVDGEWIFEIEDYLLTMIRLIVPGIDYLTPQQFEDAYADETTGVFDQRLWDGPIDR